MAPNPSPGVRIRLNFESRVWASGQAKALSLRGLGRVLLYLALLQGAEVSRSAMARTLWPTDPEDVAANRLRVSLSRLKALLGEALVSDRNHVRLSGIALEFDLQDRLAQLQEVLDDVDASHQFEQLRIFAPELRYTGWREFLELDGSGVLSEWERTCRAAVERFMALATSRRDWDAVELAWHIMRDRGDFEPAVAERLLDASALRGETDEALRKIRAAARAQGLDESGRVMTGLKNYAAGLKPASAPEPGLQSGHFHLLGASLLNQIDHHAAELGHLLSRLEVQINMQAAPQMYLEVLDAVGVHLEPGSPAWIEVQSSRVSTYVSIYDHEKVAEVCRSLFPHDIPPARGASIYMSYAFSLFQVRQWDEALAAIRQGQQIAREAGEITRAEIIRMNEGTFLKHLGKTEEARHIYTEYLAKFEDSENANDQFNCAVCRSNLAYLELVYGDLEVAATYAEAAYAQREQINLSRLLPNLVSMMSVIHARRGDMERATEFAIEGLKLTYARNSSREGQMNLEWACGVLAAGGMKEEAWPIMHWANEWRQRTKHTRSACEERYADSLDLGELANAKPRIPADTGYREVTQNLIKYLRELQAESQPSG